MSNQPGTASAGVLDTTTPDPALAHQEDHDADIPSNQSVAIPEKSTASSVEHDLEKGNAENVNEGDEDQAVEQEKESSDPDIVFWENDQDPENPLNWTAKKKWTTVGVLGICSLITPLASSMFAPGVPQVMAEFKNSNPMLATLVVSIYILGFAIGPVLIAPLSEIYGRTITYNISNVFFVIFSVCCAVSNSYGMLVGFRFLMGCAGSTPITIGGGSIADMMPPQSRASALAIWAMGPLLGPVVGPIAGGYLVEGAGWRWVYWLLTIVGGCITILAFFCISESYAPLLLQRKVVRLRKETGNTRLRSKLDTGLSPSDLLKRSLVRPMKMLFFSPIIFFSSLYNAIAYGCLYTLFTTFTFVFEKNYNFSPGSIGLTYIPIGIGMFIGVGTLGVVSDRVIKAAIARKEPITPEHRLPYFLTVPGGICLPIGLLIYGWTTQFHIHWIVPLIGTCFVGVGIIGVMMSVQNFVIDAFAVYAASAVAALTILRSIAGALIPLGALQLYDRLGLGWGNSLLAFIALALIPVPVFFRIYGPFLRTRFKVSL